MLFGLQLRHMTLTETTVKLKGMLWCALHKPPIVAEFILKNLLTTILRVVRFSYHW